MTLHDTWPQFCYAQSENRCNSRIAPDKVRIQDAHRAFYNNVRTLTPIFLFPHPHTNTNTHTEAREGGVGGVRGFFYRKIDNANGLQCYSVSVLNPTLQNYHIILSPCGGQILPFLCNSVNKSCTPYCSTILTNFLSMFDCWCDAIFL